MSFDTWTVPALFWLVFVTMPRRNAVIRINNGMTHGFRRVLVGVLTTLTQASLFLMQSALSVTALIAVSQLAFTMAKLTGAAFLFYLGVRRISGLCFTLYGVGIGAESIPQRVK